MPTYMQISITQDPKIHGSEHLSTFTKEMNDSIMITIDGNIGGSPVDIAAGSIGEMRRFARTILKICDDAEKHRRVSSQDFGMFSEEGNKAVYETLTSYGDSLNAELLGSVMTSVARQGFPEVYDTVVRENLWNFLEAKGLDD